MLDLISWIAVAWYIHDGGAGFCQYGVRQMFLERQLKSNKTLRTKNKNIMCNEMNVIKNEGYHKS